ncbi:copper homeostasis protein CutC [Aquimarina sp. D1M17]|uniref:copper homeostasis protein CutC n=1 Tax=Aquimarina acroporae TaxID=2937283 RepID=UPI0020BD5C7F|nr:copper homeostasis protein CutC [Aquimarina acroporae]MCK8521007.1 copper homeostasis protein CutC [Aquimarina acroporae]
MVIKEACVEGIKQAQIAEQNGADRIELCGDLSLGGITPSLEVIQRVKHELDIPIRVMIRPRGGDFVYSDDEFELMKKQIQYCHMFSVEGVVFGILTKNNTLDIKRIKTLVKLALPMKVVIHKAIDDTPDILKALKKVLKIDGITAVLTSGGKHTAQEGKVVLKKMVNLAKGEIEIVAAGSITSKNVHELHEYINSGYYHGRKIVF